MAPRTASTLFTPLTLPAPAGAGLHLRHRALIAPMCQYAVDAEDGHPGALHLQHLGALAAGGFSLVMAEATAVLPEGRISPRDLGLWDAQQMSSHGRLVEMIHTSGERTGIPVAAGIQLGHAGAKAGTYPHLLGFERGSVPRDAGGWETVAPVDGALQPGLAAATGLDEDGIARVIEGFVEAARRADEAGYDVIQLHAAHGYLLHQFLSPLSNTRSDRWGGSMAGRSRLVREVARAVRAVWPGHKPLGIRVSAEDWHPRGWTIDETARLVRLLVAEGLVSWVDVSTGGIAHDVRIPEGPGYQVRHAARIARALEGTGAVVSAVGVIESAAQAESILVSGQADAVSIGRAALRNPHWAAGAAAELGVPLENNPQAAPYWRAGW